jgi:hypothetical protein
VLKHQHFEEICAAASVGQATVEEVLELQQHASECGRCRRAYFDYVSLAAHEFAAARPNLTLSAQEVEECLNSDLFTRRFFDRAEREGIVFSPEVEEKIKPASIPIAFSRRRPWPIAPMATAAALVFAAIVASGYFYWKHLSHAERIASRQQSDGASNTQTSVDKRTSGLAAANAELLLQIDRLRGELRRKTNELVASETDLKATSHDRLKLASDRDALQARLEQMQHELANAESMSVTAQHEASAQSERADHVEAGLIAEQIKLHDVEERMKQESAMLDEDRQLLNASHDVTDLMGARNLHIVDVVDTDTRGKSRPAFGRIFFTEGKSLIFYAYDLNEHKMQKADYQYQVWAKKEGQDGRALRLGIFYSDDQAQRRWVFRCADPKILREIDSVFVTFGRQDSDPSHPEGSSLMYAYLRGQPNHP